MKALEGYIRYEILKSKNKMREYTTVDKLFNDKTYDIECNNYMKNHGITKNHINFLTWLRDDGNFSAHVGRPVLEMSEWYNLMRASLDDPNDPDDNKLIDDVLKLLAHYSPAPQSESWIIKSVKI